ncbi:MAG: SPASM domain-containing protein [Candidatus Omnitrophica bacterium]|nr:SPASM domain-containing protein [Candidatus Omnitrophota bacterium]
MKEHPTHKVLLSARGFLATNSSEDLVMCIYRFARARISGEYRVVVEEERLERFARFITGLDDVKYAASGGIEAMLKKDKFDTVISAVPVTLRQALINCSVFIAKGKARFLRADLEKRLISETGFADIVRDIAKNMFSRPALNSVLAALSRRLRLEKPLGTPRSLIIETVNMCNLKCPLCPTGTGSLGRTGARMELSVFKKLVDSNLGVFLNTESIYMDFYGDPLMNRDIFGMIKYLKDKGAGHVEISTNASFPLDERKAREIVMSGVDLILFAVDGADQETYSRYRKGGDLSAVKEFIKGLVRMKKILGAVKPYLVLQFILMKHNAHQLQAAKEMAVVLGADSFKIKFLDVFRSDGGDVEEFIPDDPGSAQYVKKADGYEHKRSTGNNTCGLLWSSAVIMVDGSVVPCCTDARGRVVLGNVFKRGIEHIWKGEKYRDLRREIHRDKKAIPLCRDCPSQ